MKSIPAALLAHNQQTVTTLAHALRITRTDAQVYGFTSCDVDAEIDGVVYKADPGLITSNVSIAADFAVGNLELSSINDSTVFSVADVLGGKWDNAAFLLFRYNWVSIGDGVEKVLGGVIGEVGIRRGYIVAELRDLRQYLQQPVGSSSSKTCRYRLGDTKCSKNLASFTHSGSITSVTNNSIFRDNSVGQAEDYFGEGKLTWNTGNNSGLTIKVRDFAADGTFTLVLPMFSSVQVGDTYTAIAGCRLRRDEDCRDKFANAINFGGEPDRRTANSIIATP